MEETQSRISSCDLPSGGDDGFNAILREVARLSAADVHHARPLQPGDLLAGGRLRVQGRLGNGASAIVYRAEDMERGEHVALKHLLRFDAASIFALKREFRAVSHVRHENLVRLHELFGEGDRWFFTMELVDGVRFDRWVRPDDKLDVGRLERSLQQLLLATRTIHDTGKLHRDLKPSNVLVAPDGRVVVLDFGLVTDADTASSLAGDVCGTPAYMAPEQRQGFASHASDYFSIGVMLFQALTGSLPTAACARLNRAEDAIVGLMRVSGCPRDLAQLCCRLLAPVPDARLLALEPWLRSVAIVGDGASTSRAPDRQIVGRARELALLGEACDRASAGMAQLVTVRGESGIGKSTLCGAFLASLGQRPLIFSGRCFERESVPFNALDPLVDELRRVLQRRTPAQLRVLLPVGSVALARLFPVLDGLMGTEPCAAERVVDPAHLRRLAFEAFAVLLQRLRFERPVVLVVDDVQWLDGDSAIFLRHLFVRRDLAPVLFVLSYRTNLDATQKPLESVLDLALANPCLAVHEMELRGLAHDETRALVQRTLVDGEAAGEQLADRVAQEAQGNPFFALQLAGLAREAWGAPAVAPALGQVVSTRLSSLYRVPRRLVELIALAGQPLPLELALKASGASHEDLDALRAGRFLQLVRVGTMKAVDCDHDRIRRAAIGMLDDSAQRILLRALAAPLLEAPDVAPELLIRCLVDGLEDPVRAARHAVLEAQRAESSFAFERAAALYERALALHTASDEQRLTLTLCAARCFESTGRGTDAARLYEAAAQLAEGESRLDLQRLGAEQLLAVGHAHEGSELLRGVCRQLDLSLPVSNAHALLSLLYTHLRLRYRGVQHAPRVDEPCSSELLRLRTVGTTVNGFSGYVPLQAASAAGRYLQMALETGSPEHLVRALGFNAHVLAFVDPDDPLASTLCAETERVALKSGDRRLVGFSGVIAGGINYCRGHFSEARRHLRQAITTLRGSVGFAWDLDAAEVYDQFSALMCGDLAEVALNTPRAIEDAWRRGRVWAGAMFSGFGGVAAWLTPDDAGGYARVLEEAKRRWRPLKEPQWPDYFLTIGEAMCSIYRGDPRAAFDLLLDTRRAYRRSMLTRGSQMARAWYALHFATCAAAVLPVAQDPAQARATLARTTRVLRPLPHAHWRGHVHGFAASLAVRDGDRETAARELAQAVRLHDLHGKRLYSAAARLRLGAILGGAEGRQMQAQGARAMAAEGVKDWHAMSAVLCPGCEA